MGTLIRLNASRIQVNALCSEQSDADLESAKTSATPFSKSKIAAFLRMDFPICSTPCLGDSRLFWRAKTVYHKPPRPYLICQEIETLLVYHETYCHPLINFAGVSAVRLGSARRLKGARSMASASPAN